ncbi:NADH-quinone oxidoreductase subunit H [bacterium]|nr:MAG: NADH-quinone oxidoreductase subunit H [bacterium]
MIVVRFLIVILPILLAVAFLTLFERKVLAAAGKRVGPNVVGNGFLQPLADGLKLLTKETILPTSADPFLYFFAPVISFSLALINFSVLPIGNGVLTLNLSVLFVLAVSGLSVYGVVLAGWASNSRYAFLGSLRATAQMISYEVSLGLILLSNCLITETMDLHLICLWQQHYGWLLIPLFPGSILFFLSSLAETNRPPFDLPEAEGELVAGYYVEYASAGFALFFIGEYANIIFLSSLWGVLFAGGFSCWLSCFIMFGFIWVRSAYPRYRYDQLMRLGWKIFLPLSLSLFFLSFVCVTF